MNPIIKNILAVVAGIIIGSIVNMAFIVMSSRIIPPPDGSDLTTSEGLIASMHLMEPKHFIFPFLAHAIGTFVGAILAVKIAVTHKMKLSFAIGVIFLVGGIINVMILPSPLWFTILDLLGAYIPMSFLAWKIGGKK